MSKLDKANEQLIHLAKIMTILSASVKTTSDGQIDLHIVGTPNGVRLPQS